jgi:hypothetical protein
MIMKHTLTNNSFRVTLLATALTIAVAPATNAIAESASTPDKLLAQQTDSSVPSPLVILSQRVGDVGREAIGSGIPTLRSSALAAYPGLKIIYADVDSIDKDQYREVVNAMRAAVNRGDLVALETSEFDFPLLKNFIMRNFPEADISGFNDVAIILRSEGKQIRAERLDPIDLAMYAGIPYSEIASRLPRAPADQGFAYSKSVDGSKFQLDLSIKAYESTPTYSGWALRYNGTYVDVWQAITSPGACTVAWRGTVLSHIPDVYADLSSQVSYASTSIDNAAGVTMKGGKGFVNRLHAYDNIVKGQLESLGCNYVGIMGHSLGAAVASIHALQLAHDTRWRGPLLYVTAFNSPNVIDYNTQRDRLAELKKYATVNVNCRYHDWLVNPLPTGLHRIGDPNSTPVKGCTYVKTGTTWSADPNANHRPELWYAEF